MIRDFAIVVSSCDAYSDLWRQHFFQLKQNWVGPFPTVYLVTDKPTSFSEDNIKTLVLDGEMPTRIKKACELVKERYLLITLDDYFLVEKVLSEHINYLLCYIIKNHIDYLSIYDRWHTKKFKKRFVNVVEDVDFNKKYAVNLYPAIWNKELFIKCATTDKNPWLFEPTLTKKTKELGAKCCFNRGGIFLILDVVRKGKILRKADRYFRKNGIKMGDRPLIERKTEVSLFLMDFVQHYFPKPLVRFLKRIAIKCGKSFYSED